MVGITVMLTSLGVLFALAVVARLRMVNLDDSTSLGGVMQGLPPNINTRLTMAFGGPSAPLFGASQQKAVDPGIYA